MQALNEPTARETPGTTIVLADDHTIVRSALRALLEAGDGVEVVAEAADIEETVRKVLAYKPNVLVLDVSMPGLTGWELCEIVRRQPITRDLPILFLTGRGEVRDRITAMQVGGTDHLTKPFRAEELRARVRALTASGPGKGES